MSDNKQVIVPDTSVIIEGILSKKNIKNCTVLIHEAVIAELESQANKRREIGYLGLEEIKKLQKKYEVKFAGFRPKEFEIKYAKSGEIDSLIRQLAFDTKATLYTADIVQGLVAEAKGIKTLIFRKSLDEKITDLEKFFSKDVMSVHLKQGCKSVVKKGKPGSWKIVFGKKVGDVEAIAKNLVSVARRRKDSYVEQENKNSTIMQLGPYRIVITRPPLSDAYEITAVKNIKKLSLKNYDLSPELLNRINKRAEGILIAGSPGSGKSTFAQALANHYATAGKVIKTVESPRDLDLGDDITQYSLKHASSEEIRDIFLLSRPDISVFDEVRNDSDFSLFTDLRLSGVGMIGVVHATKAIDSLQRFIQRIDMGVIPNVIDTLIFISQGSISEVYTVVMEVKVPYGMTESDLARPVVGIHDANSGMLKFEIYSYGDQKVVMPVGKDYEGGVLNLARKEVERELKLVYDKVKAYVMNNKILVHTDDVRQFLGVNNRILKSLEKKFGMKIDVRQVKFKETHFETLLKFSSRIDGSNLYLIVSSEIAGKDVSIYVGDDLAVTTKVGKKGKIKLSRSSPHAMLIEKELINNNVRLHL